MKRFFEIDLIRGIAIIMMIVFHLMWDLNYFGLISAGLYSGFWGVFQKITAGLFLLLAGAMLAITSQKHGDDYVRHSFIRGAKIFFTGVLLTIASWLLFPEQFIYFGILHLIGFAVIISPLFAKRKYFALLFSAIILAVPAIYNTQLLGLDFLVWAGFASPLPSLDFTPVVPWIGVVLLGVFLGNLFYPNAKRAFRIREQNTILSDSVAAKKIQFLGRHSLLIYLIHQPILFCIIWLIAANFGIIA